MYKKIEGSIFFFLHKLLIHISLNLNTNSLLNKKIFVQKNRLDFFEHDSYILYLIISYHLYR